MFLSYKFLFLITFVVRIKAKESPFQSLDFELFGEDQWIDFDFRKDLQLKATELGVKGFCQNYKNGAVVGVMQGTAEAIDKLKYWIQTNGTYSSRIDKTSYTPTLQFFIRDDFQVFT